MKASRFTNRFASQPFFVWFVWAGVKHCSHCVAVGGMFPCLAVLTLQIGSLKEVSHQAIFALIGAVCCLHTLRSEIVTQLIPQKLFHAVNSRISRNPARANSLEILWCNDRTAIAQIDSWKHAAKTTALAEGNDKLCNCPENNSPRVISRNRMRQFRAIPRKRIPQYFFRVRNVFGMEGNSVIEATAMS